jgi:putative toxin-antitoxin system antitoxin component (TIGR02293 family)
MLHLAGRLCFFDGVVMSAPTTALRRPNKKDELRNAAIAAFWEFISHWDLLKESERLLQIKAGFSAELFQVVRITFNLQDRSVEKLLNASISTLERRRREQKPLTSVASERLDRVAVVCHLAEAVLQSRDTAICWMSKPNKVFGGDTPVMLCETEIGAKQVSRVLQALEWGGTA